MLNLLRDSRRGLRGQGESQLQGWHLGIASPEGASFQTPQEGSYERLFHDVGVPGFLLSMRDQSPSLLHGLSKPRLERAIGVIYRPDSELASHYFQAMLPRQFDEYIWVDSTQAVQPIDTAELEGLPGTYPFGL